MSPTTSIGGAVSRLWQPHSAAIALATIPAVVWAAWPAPEEHRIVVKAVETEGIRAQRMDADTFGLRWSVVYQLPPAVARANDGGAGQGAQAGGQGVATPSRLQRTTRRAALRGDICARHGMRKVHYGKRWRCRR